MSSSSLSALWTSWHPSRFNSDVKCSVKAALKYSLAELDALSSLIMQYISCHNLRWLHLSPPLTCKLMQHRAMLYLWVLPAWYKACAHCWWAKYIKDQPSVRPGAVLEPLHRWPLYTLLYTSRLLAALTSEVESELVGGWHFCAIYNSNTNRKNLESKIRAVPLTEIA